MAQLVFQCACYFVGIGFLYTVAILYATDTNYFREEEVIVPVHVKEEEKTVETLDGKAEGDDADGKYEVMSVKI